MGDPRRPRKKYSTPSHPWQKERILEEAQLMADYGTKNKKEIWKMRSMLKKFSRQAKSLATLPASQAEVEKKRLLDKMKSIGLIKEDATLESALAVTLPDIMGRRLQTIVFRKNLARTIKQARQFIVHKHIKIGEKAVTSPSYIVKVSEEPLVDFSRISSLSNMDHPEREVKVKVDEKAVEEPKKKPKRRKEDFKKADKKGRAKKPKREIKQKTEGKK